jgi:hypothetical protein
MIENAMLTIVEVGEQGREDGQLACAVQVEGLGLQLLEGVR